jgi:hypothetical protein
MQIWNEFTQVSEELGFKMDLEDILGFVAITTFLVGFSSVRLQSILEELKDGEARKIDRVLEQNAGKDLLPLPTSLEQMEMTQNFSPDKTTIFTILLTWLNFVIASVLIGVHQANSDLSSKPFWFVQIVHFFIVLIGTFGPKFAKTQFSEYKKKQPFECYAEMIDEIKKWLKDEKHRDTLLQKVEDFDASIPEWSWLTLIRCSLVPAEKSNPQLKRIYDLVEPQKDADDYSLIAFVWSAYLLDDGKLNSIARNVKYSDIAKIIEFVTPRSLLPLPSPKSPEERDNVLKNFLKLDFQSTDVEKDNVINAGSVSARIFVRLTVEEIVKVLPKTQFKLMGKNKQPFGFSDCEYISLSIAGRRKSDLHWMPVDWDTNISGEPLLVNVAKLAQLVAVLLEEIGQITNSSSAEKAISSPRLQALAVWLKDAKDVRLIVS